MDGAATNDRTLRRIIAMLVALAVLAERAADRSLPVRWSVLVLLRHAETVALALVVEATQAGWAGFEQPPEAGSNPADAVLLGMRLRMLATVLAALLDSEGRPDEDGACIVRAAHRLASALDRLLAVPGGAALVPHDTS